MISTYFFVAGVALILGAAIYSLYHNREKSGVFVTARVKKVVTRDNRSEGYLTSLERDQTYVFEYGGHTVEKTEELSGILYEEGQELNLLYQPKKNRIFHPGEKKFNPVFPVAMVLGGLVLIYSGFAYDKSQPSVAVAAAVALVIFAGFLFFAMKNAIKKDNEVACRIIGIFRAKEKKGTYYFPVYELEYRGKRRRIIRSFQGNNEKSQIGKTDYLHIDPFTSDFAEGRRGVYQLFIGISLTLCIACLMLALYLNINPIAF